MALLGFGAIADLAILEDDPTDVNVVYVGGGIIETGYSDYAGTHPEGNIVLDLKVENNTPDFSKAVNGIPSIRTSESSTRVLVSDGGTTVIGGILTSTFLTLVLVPILYRIFEGKPKPAPDESF